jgi:hypothetical protein
MRTSSARQLELEGLGTNPASPEQRRDSGEVIGVPVSDAPIAPPTALRVPDFGVRDPVYAATARLAGRLNASAVSEAEHNSLLRDRQILLDKQFAATITPKEKNRLEYIRWSLDRIEDAKYGQALDVLADAASMYERFVLDVTNFRDDVMQYTRGGTQRKRGRK